MSPPPFQRALTGTSAGNLFPSRCPVSGPRTHPPVFAERASRAFTAKLPRHGLSSSHAIREETAGNPASQASWRCSPDSRPRGPSAASRPASWGSATTALCCGSAPAKNWPSRRIYPSPAVTSASIGTLPSPSAIARWPAGSAISLPWAPGPSPPFFRSRLPPNLVQNPKARSAREPWRSLKGRESWLDRFLDGFLALAQAHETPLAGGDLAESPLRSPTLSSPARCRAAKLCSAPAHAPETCSTSPAAWAALPLASPASPNSAPLSYARGPARG